MFDGFAEGVMALMILCALMLPLALWKVIDILVWLYQNVSISIAWGN